MNEHGRKRWRLMLSRSAVLVALVAAITACRSPVEHAADRSEELRLMYPAGTTSRDDVQERWGDWDPELSATRPVEGWESYPDAKVLRRVLGTEERTEMEVHRVEKYLGVEGSSMSFSLCYCWYYYDAEDRVVDVEWQYCSD